MCITEHIVEAARETKKVEHQTKTHNRLLLRPATTLLQSSAQLSGSPLWSSGILPVRTYTPRLSTPTLVSWPPGHVALRQTSGMVQHSDSAHPRMYICHYWCFWLLGHVGVTAGPSVLVPSRASRVFNRTPGPSRTRLCSPPLKHSLTWSATGLASCSS